MYRMAKDKKRRDAYAREKKRAGKNICRCTYSAQVSCITIIMAYGLTEVFASRVAFQENCTGT